MRSGAAPLPWVAIGFFCVGSYLFLTFLYALGDPNFCSAYRHCMRLYLVYALLGRWGVRLVLLILSVGCLYLPFADSNMREL